MLIFPTQQLAEDYFANGLRLVTTARDFFKDLDRAFKNWSEGLIVEAWEKDSYDIMKASEGQY
jgi:hypothetical protein